MGALSVVGLSELEERLFEELAGRGGATVVELEEATGVPARSIVPALRRLADRALINQVSSRPRRYLVAAPDHAVETLARDVERAVAHARARAGELAQLARSAAERLRPTELVEVVEGANAIEARFIQLQRSARKDIRLFDRPPYVAEGGENPTEADVLAAGVRWRAIYDRALLDNPVHVERISRCIKLGEEARTLPDLPLKLAIVDSELAMVPLTSQSRQDERPPAALVIRPSVLLDSMVAMFEALWARSVPLEAALNPTAVGTNDPQLVEILGLLASGMKDEVIARQLGVNVRTVRRRVRAALDALGVESRFQAGMRASELGMLSGSGQGPG